MASRRLAWSRRAAMRVVGYGQTTSQDFFAALAGALTQRSEDTSRDLRLGGGMGASSSPDDGEKGGGVGRGGAADDAEGGGSAGSSGGRLGGGAPDLRAAVSISRGSCIEMLLEWFISHHACRQYLDNISEDFLVSCGILLCGRDIVSNGTTQRGVIFVEMRFSTTLEIPTKLTLDLTTPTSICFEPSAVTYNHLPLFPANNQTKRPFISCCEHFFTTPHRQTDRRTVVGTVRRRWWTRAREQKGMQHPLPPLPPSLTPMLLPTLALKNPSYPSPLPLPVREK